MKGDFLLRIITLSAYIRLQQLYILCCVMEAPFIYKNLFRVFLFSILEGLCLAQASACAYVLGHSWGNDLSTEVPKAQADACARLSAILHITCKLKGEVGSREEVGAIL